MDQPLTLKKKFTEQAPASYNSKLSNWLRKTVTLKYVLQLGLSCWVEISSFMEWYSGIVYHMAEMHEVLY
jgi:hypothetical protein